MILFSPNLIKGYAVALMDGTIPYEIKDKYYVSYILKRSGYLKKGCITFRFLLPVIQPFLIYLLTGLIQPLRLIPGMAVELSGKTHAGEIILP